MPATPAFRFWGGVKIPFSTPIQDDCLVTVTVNYVLPFPWGSTNLPKVYWQTDQSSGRVQCAIGVAFELTIPAESNNLEFFMEYSTSNVAELTSTSFSGGVEVIVDSGEDHAYIPTFGLRKFDIKLKRIDGRSYIYPFPHSASAGPHADSSSAYYYQNFQFSTPLLRSCSMRLLDISGSPIANNGSQAAQEASSWNELPNSAPWPLFSSGTNLNGPGLPPTENFFVEYTSSPTKDDGWQTAAMSGEWFTIPAYATAFRMRRLYAKNTVANALAAVKAIKPTVTRLHDRFLLECKDAGIHSPAFVGRDNRIVPQKEVVTEFVTTAF